MEYSSANTSVGRVLVGPRGPLWEVWSNHQGRLYPDKEQALAVAKELCRVGAPACLWVFDAAGVLVSRRPFLPNANLPWRRASPLESGEYSVMGLGIRDVV